MILPGKNNFSSHSLPALSLLPDLALALFFLLNLGSPEFFGSGVIVYLMLLVYTEFFVVFSAGFLGMVLASSVRRFYKAAGFAVMSAGYTAVIVLIGMRFDQTWPVWAFLALSLNRLFGIYVNSEPEDRSVYARDGWIVCSIIYLGGAFLASGTGLEIGSFASGSLPGISAADEQRHWFLNPNAVIFFGFVYFFCITIYGLLRIFYRAWFKDPGTGEAVHQPPE